MALPLTDADFSFNEELFRSQTGTVWRVSFRKAAGAAGDTSKALRRAGIRDGGTYVLKERRAPELGRQKTIMREIDLLLKLDHPNIVRCLGHFRGRARGGAPPRGGGVRGDDVLYMLLEYANGGDLYKEICRRKKLDDRRRAPAGAAVVASGTGGRRYFSEREVLDIFHQLCLGVQHLHERGIVHRDIKALNVLRSGKEGQWTYKLGDLGVGRELGLDTIMMQTFYGTPLYASPELCANRPYNELTDIWSLGVLLYEICALDHPFSARNLMGLAKAISEADYPPLAADLYSPFVRDMVAAMLKKDWRKRPRINEVIGWLESQEGLRHRAPEGEEEEVNSAGAGSNSLKPNVRTRHRRPDSRKSRAGSKGTRRPPSAVSSLTFASAGDTSAGDAAGMKNRAARGIRGKERDSVSARSAAEKNHANRGESRDRSENRNRRRSRPQKQAWQDAPVGSTHQKPVRRAHRQQTRMNQIDPRLAEPNAEEKYAAKEDKVLSERERKRASRRDKTIRVRREQSHERHGGSVQGERRGADFAEGHGDREHELSEYGHDTSGPRRGARRIRVRARKQRGHADEEDERYSPASPDGNVMSDDSLEDQPRVSSGRSNNRAHSVTKARNNRDGAVEIRRTGTIIERKVRRGSRRASTGANALQRADRAEDSFDHRSSDSSGESEGAEYGIDVERKKESPRTQNRASRSGERRQRGNARIKRDTSSLNSVKNISKAGRRHDPPRNLPGHYDLKQQESDTAAEIATQLNVTRRPLDMTSRQEQHAENELRRKRLHLERLVKAKGWQKEQRQQRATEIDAVRKEIESLHSKITSRRGHDRAKKIHPPRGKHQSQKRSQKDRLPSRRPPRPSAHDSPELGGPAVNRERRRGVGRGESLRLQRASARDALYGGGSKIEDDPEDYSRPSTRSSSSSLRDERLEQRWLERSKRIGRSHNGADRGARSSRHKSDGTNPPLSVVGGLHGRSGSRVSSAGSSASRSARTQSLQDGSEVARGGCQTSRYSRAAGGFASMLTDESGLSHTRAGLKLRQHHHHRDRGGSRASAKAALEPGVSDTESESGPSHGESGLSDSSEDDAGDQRLDRDDAAAGSDEEDLWMTDEIGDLKLQKEAYERRLDLHKMELQRRPGMSRFTGHVGGINDGSVESARSWNPITSSWSSVASSERY